MRHKNAGRQFGRDTKHRRSLFRNLVTALLEHGRIETTLMKANCREDDNHREERKSS